MCLELTKDAKSQIANEDIVCYKRIITRRHVSRMTLTSYDKKSFTGIIFGIKCKGKIQVENNEVYFCTNESKLNGSPCYDKLGYSYSWKFDNNIHSLIIDGVDVANVSEDSIFLTPYQRVKVQIGETYTSALIQEPNEDGNLVINIGLHSFTTYKDARNNGPGNIVKCIIPKGSEYYLGEFGDYNSYASNQLKYLEIV